MVKKALFWVFIALLFLGSAFLSYFILNKLNQRRFHLASYYDNTAASTVSPNEQLTYLIKSDALVPDSSKKVAIALLFLNQNQPTKAEYYLKFAPNHQGGLLLAEYYLLNDPQNAGKYIQSVSDSTEKQELNDFLALTKSDQNKPTPSIKPKTDVGTLIAAINTQDYSLIAGLPLLKAENNALTGTSNANTKTFTLSKYFLSTGKPYLAIYTLHILEGKIGETPVIDAALAEGYDQAGDHSKAETEISQAISLSPADISLYQKGVALAQKANDQSKADFWTDRIKELQSLQS